MEKVADNQFLQKRGDNWSYFRRVPAHLVPLLKRTFIKKSLSTSDIKKARSLRNIETVRVDALFARLERNGIAALPGETKLGAKHVSLPVLEEYIRKAVTTIDRQSEDRLAADPASSADELGDMRFNAEIELGILKNPDDPRRDEWIASFGERVLRDAGAEIENREELIRFGSLVRRALIELQVRKLGRYDDDPAGHRDPLFDPKRKPEVSFKALAAQYFEERKLDGDLNRINRKTIDKDEAIIRTLVEIIGAKTPVADIDYDWVREVQVVISRLPSNRAKLYPGKSLAAVLKLSDANPEGRLAPLTQRSYLDVFADIMALGLKKRLLPSNPALDVKPLKRDDVAPEDKRKPWRPEQLKAFFEGKFYRRFAPDADKPYAKADVAWRFWIPLIMLYSGARPNEIAQLTAADFQETPKGTVFMNLMDDGTDDDEGGGRRAIQVKTDTSRRRIPVHSHLRRFGLLDFADHVSEGGRNPDARLFPSLTQDEYGNYAWYALRRFNEFFFKEETTLDRRQSAYSLRHNVRDALRAVEAPASALKAITGWAPGTKAASDSYGDPGNPDFHAKWVEMIQYDLDLHFLTGAGSKLTPPVAKRRQGPPVLRRKLMPRSPASDLDSLSKRRGRPRRGSVVPGG
jgi:integrase